MPPPPPPRLETDRLVLLLAGADYADRMVDYYRRNQGHLEPWEPRRTPEFLSTAWWSRQLEANLAEYQADRGARMVLCEKDDPEGRVIGVANLSQVVRGAFQACHLGYSIDQELEGQGLMREALERLVRWTFEDLGLHRIMANYRPENVRSAAVLERLGFVQEGYARDYLHIDGAWRDHVLTALTRRLDGTKQEPTGGPVGSR